MGSENQFSRGRGEDSLYRSDDAALVTKSSSAALMIEGKTLTGGNQASVPTQYRISKTLCSRLTACNGDGDNKGRRSGTRRSLGGVKETGVVGGDDEPDDEHAPDVEDEDTPEGPLDSERDVLARILALSDGDTNCRGGSNVSKCAEVIKFVSH